MTSARDANSDHNGRKPLADSGQGGGARLAGLPAGERCNGDAQGFEPTLEVQSVLVGEQFGGRHERHLPAQLYRLGGREGRNQRFAAADVALHQAQHGFCVAQVLLYLTQYAHLCRRQLKRQRRQQVRLQSAVGDQRPARVALNPLTQQLERQLMRQ